MVRFKVLSNNGAIKGQGLSIPIWFDLKKDMTQEEQIEQTFNSYMVRFKDSLCIVGYINIMLSIPIWFDLKRH